MATTANRKPVQSSSAATGEKPSFLLFGGLALIGLLKDTLDLIGIGSLPVLGTGITLCFSFFSFMLLLLFDRSGSRGNKRLAQGMVVTFGTIIEGIGFVINFLPLQTLTAVFLYIISYRSWKSVQRSAAVVAKSQRKKLQTQQARMARAIALREERLNQQAANDTSSGPANTAQERPAGAPQMANFPVSVGAVRQPIVPPVVAAAAFSAARAGVSAADSRSGSLPRSAPEPAPAQSQSGVGAAFRSSGSISNPQSAGPVRSVSETLPVMKTEHGYGIDIGNGEVFGEYRTADEAKRAVPDAIRSRDARQAYLRNQKSATTQPLPGASVAAVAPSVAAVSSAPKVVARDVNMSSVDSRQSASSISAPSRAGARLEAFDARRELAGLKAAPKAERREKLVQIKQKLSQQTKGLAQVQASIYSMIRNNPDASYDDLHNAMVQQGAAYGMNDRQREVGDDVLKKYVAKHEQIRELRNQYSDDRELFKAFFGRSPKGDVKVVDGPMTFYFKCQDVNDFALIRSQSFIEGREPTAGELAEAAGYGGLAGVSTLIPGINGSVMAENSSHAVFQKSPAQSETVRTHEEQHVMNHLFAEQFDEARDVISRFHEAGTRGEKEVAVEDYLRYFQQKAEEESRDEILAYFKDGRSLDEILKTLSLKKNEGGGYDFLVEDRSMGEYNVAVLFGEEFQSYARTKAGKMYDTEYREHLNTALQSVDRLTKAGYDKDQAIALLVHEPLSRWDKVTGRLLAGSNAAPTASPTAQTSREAASSREQLPIVKSDHGFAVDVGGGEVFGEYQSEEEARQAIPEAIRSRDGRQAYLKSQSQAVSVTPENPVIPAPVPTNAPIRSAAPQPSGQRSQLTTSFTRLKDISNDASARIREAGSRLSQLARPNKTVKPVRSAQAFPQSSARSSQGVAPVPKEPASQPATSTVVSKEQLFEARIAARMRNPNQPLDDSKMTEQLFQRTPEYTLLSQRGRQIDTMSSQIGEIEGALRSYLSVKNSQQGMHGSGEYMETGNQQIRVDAATRLHELSKKYEATFPYLKRYTDWKNINWTNAARSLEIHQDTVNQYRQEKEKFDREVSTARSKFNQGLTNDYQAWLNRRSGQKRSV